MPTSPPELGWKGLLIVVAMAASLGLPGCKGSSWRPPAPRGRTWVYSSQAAFVRASASAGGNLGRIPYFFHFSGAGFTGPKEGQPPDRFWREQSAGDRRLFNAHLEGQGERIGHGPDGPVVAPATAKTPRPGGTP
jgi:hypothetical protein